MPFTKDAIERLAGFGSRFPVLSLEMFPDEQPAKRAMLVLLHPSNVNNVLILSESIVRRSLREMARP